MALLQQLVDEDSNKIVGILGGKGRNILINQLAMEAANHKKRVIITHINGHILPPSGHISYNADENKLIGQIKREFDNEPVIYAAKSLDDHFVRGVSTDFVQRLKNLPGLDIIFLILGNASRLSILARKDISRIIGLNFLDRLIYCFQFDLINQPLNQEVVKDPDAFLKNFPRYKSEKIFHQDMMTDYLTDSKNGAFRLFQQKWPVLLVLTDINNVLLENRCIALARDLSAKGIEHIFQANLKDNIVKRIPAR